MIRFEWGYCESIYGILFLISNGIFAFTLVKFNIYEPICPLKQEASKGFLNQYHYSMLPGIFDWCQENYSKSPLQILQKTQCYEGEGSSKQIQRAAAFPASIIVATWWRQANANTFWIVSHSNSLGQLKGHTHLIWYLSTGSFSDFALNIHKSSKQEA